MILQSIYISQFKNIRDAALDFSPKINLFLGLNGVGKSNLLDAIYLLSLTKSSSGAPDQSLIMRGEEFFTLRADYLRRDTPETLSCGLKAGGRKVLRRGDKAYRRVSDHIGAFPLVISAPSDLELATGSPECRRRFIDNVISQSDPLYLDALLRYNRALEQRNSLLRNELTDPILYEALETPMAEAAALITERRIDFIDRLSELFDHYHGIITDSRDPVTVTYQSSMADGTTLPQLLESHRQRDLILHHTSVGPHRDDLDLQLHGMPLRRTASQGQAKSYTVALRLAQYHFLRQATGITPLLLLDDLFDKLDAERVHRIIELVSSPDFGQIFITDTGREHMNIDAAVWQVHDGSFSPQPRV